METYLLLAIVGILFAFLLYKRIEIAYVFFVTSGLWKEYPWITLINTKIDITFVLFSILVLNFIFKLLKNKKIKSNVIASLVYLFILFFYMTISLLYCTNIEFGFDKTIKFAMLSIGTVIFPIICFNKPKEIRNVFFLLLAFSYLYAISNLYIGTGYVFNTDYIGVARLIGLGVIISMVYMINIKNNRLINFFLLASVIIFSISILITGSRQVLLSLFIIVIYYFMYFVTRFSLKSKLKYLTGLIFILFIILFLNYKQYIQLNSINRLIELILNINSTGGIFKSDLNRLSLFRAAISGFIKNPVIGKGIASYYSLIGFDSIYVYPHNIILEILCELGAIGIAIVIFFSNKVYRDFKYFTKYTLPSTQSRFYIQIINLILVYSLINSMVSGDINSNKYIWLALGLFYSLYNMESLKTGVQRNEA